MSKSEAALPSASNLIKRSSQAPISRDNLLGTIESLLGPSALVFSLWAIALSSPAGSAP